MPDWDEDSARLRKSLARILDEIVRDAEKRKPLSVETARRWHALLMRGLTVPDERFTGAFRGERGLELIQVRVGARYGASAANVAAELGEFENRLQKLVAQLDSTILIGEEPDADQLAAIVDLCAWVHAEWIRIHPFANGNGRTARLWANCLAIRYGLPPFICLRPRPDLGYAEAGAKAMGGDWKPTASVFRRLLNAFLAE